MKKLFPIALSILSICAARAADIQIGLPNPGSPIAVMTGGTNNVAGLTTQVYTTNLFVIDASLADDIGLEFSLRSIGATTNGSANFRIGKSIGGGIYDTNTTWIVAVPLNGPSNVVLLTNLNVNGLASLNISSLDNTNANALTNVSVRVRQKAKGIVVRTR
jgi:hypothetical protein